MSDQLRTEAEAGALEARELASTIDPSDRWDIPTVGASTDDVSSPRPTQRGWYVYDLGGFWGPYEDELVAVVASVDDQFSRWAVVLNVAHIGVKR